MHLEALTRLIQTSIVLIHLAVYTQAIDFQVGNYLHKFFKKFLPNNTNYQRKPHDENPYKKYERMAHTNKSTTIEDLPDIEGLSFQVADMNFPTLPSFGNLSFVTYRASLSSHGTTPSKESVSKFGNVFQSFFGQKSGFLKHIMDSYKEYLKQEGKTDNAFKENIDDTYDENLDNALKMCDKKLQSHLDKAYTNQSDITTNLYTEFVHDLKDIYKEKMDPLFSRRTEETESTTELQWDNRKKSEEERDEEMMKQLRNLDDTFVNRSDVEEALKDVVTPNLMYT